MPQDYTGSLSNTQQIDLAVDGPDGANRLYICSGRLVTPLGYGNSNRVISFLVGPKLGLGEFRRATCNVGLNGFQIQATLAHADTPSRFCQIVSAEADWDDEAQQIQVTVEQEASADAQALGIHYQVMILAKRQ